MLKTELRGRRREQETLEGMLRDVRAGRSRTLLLRGVPGVGKTILLNHLADRASFGRVLRVAGVESESRIAYSALQQLCAPLLKGIDRLPPPQRAALSTAFALSSGEPPDPMILGVATLGLLAGAAAEQPLIAVVDDAQWLDPGSALILAFVARRLTTGPVALVFAARDTDGSSYLTGLPELRVEGLADADARALLDAALTGPVDDRVRDRIVAETRGNPLDLLELTRGMSPAELAFGFGGLHRPGPLGGRVEQAFRRKIEALPADARTVLLIAAIEPVGDPLLLRRAVDRLGLTGEPVAYAEGAGLLDVGACVRFPHPLMRTAAWRRATAAEVRQAHRALAEVTDPARDPDRRAWHLAHATAGPDDEATAELERSAGRALARGGRSAAAAFLERAAELTRDPGRRGALLLSAADARFAAGSYDRVPELLSMAELCPLGDLDRARAQRLRARVRFAMTHGRDAGPPLLAAARRLRDLDPAAARDTFLSALGAAFQAGRFGGDDLRRAAEAARGAWYGHSFPDLLLSGLVSWVLDGRTAAAPVLDRALDAMGPDDAGLTWLAGFVAHETFRIDVLERMGERAVGVARATGARSLLPTALAVRAGSLLYAGRLADAAVMLDEADAVTRSTGGPARQGPALMLAAYRGRERDALDLIHGQLAEAATTGNGRLHSLAHHCAAVLHNGLGNHRAAMDAALEAGRYDDLALHTWSLSELVEAAVRAGEPAVAAAARERLAARAGVNGKPWARGRRALADALAGPAELAGENYRTAVELLAAPETAVEGHRARLLHGEWLRREGRRAEAREPLRTAYEAFSSMGAEAFAERARRELAAAGETARARVAAGGGPALTPQERVIAERAAAGRTNQEISEALFLSPRTVEWHLRKIFTKLGIVSRRELSTALY